jgi:hypothetical protein
VREPVGADAGVVEQQVDPAEPLHGRLDRRGHCGVVAHVRHRGQRAALGLQRRELVGRSHRIAGVGERRGDVDRRDVVARAGQRERRGPALPVGGAGDQRDGPAHATRAR